MTKLRFYASLEPLKNCTHGPASEYWPWWKLFGILMCKIGVCAPSTGYRVWIYIRNVGGVYFDLIFDRRGTS